MRNTFFGLVLSALIGTQGATAQTSGSCENSVLRGFLFCTLEVISSIDLQVDSSHLEGHKPELERFLRLRLQNSLSMMRFENIPVLDLLSRYRDNEAEVRRRGLVDCRIWTVGHRGQLTAMHVQCELTSLSSDGVPFPGYYKREILSLSAPNNLLSNARNSLEGVITDVAGAFLDEGARAGVQPSPRRPQPRR